MGPESRSVAGRTGDGGRFRSAGCRAGGLAVSPMVGRVPDGESAASVAVVIAGRGRIRRTGAGPAGGPSPSWILPTRRLQSCHPAAVGSDRGRQRRLRRRRDRRRRNPGGRTARHRPTPAGRDPSTDPPRSRTRTERRYGFRPAVAGTSLTPRSATERDTDIIATNYNKLDSDRGFSTYHITVYRQFLSVTLSGVETGVHGGLPGQGRGGKFMMDRRRRSGRGVRSHGTDSARR